MLARAIRLTAEMLRANRLKLQATMARVSEEAAGKTKGRLGRAYREYERAENRGTKWALAREQNHVILVSGRSREISVRRFYILYIIYTPNLGLVLAVLVLEREQGRFRGSRKGVWGSTEGAGGSTEGAEGSIIGQCRGAAVGA